MNREDVAMDVTVQNVEILRGRLEQAEALLLTALHEMCNTTAPRNSFTDAVDAIDAFLYPQQGEQHSCKNCLGVDPASCMFKHPDQAEGAQGEREALLSDFDKALAGAVAAAVKADASTAMGQALLKSRAALAQPSPAPELELPEVVAWVQPISGMNEFFRSEADAIAERAEYLASFEPEPEDLELKPEALIRLADFDRIVGALRAEIEKFKAANGEISSKLLGRRMAVIRLKAENATLREERDAAQARVAELEKQEPVGYVWPDELAAESRGNPTGFVASRIPHPRMLPLYANPAAQAGQAPEEVRHWSDCATNNRGCPELLGPCDCGGYKEGDA